MGSFGSPEVDRLERLSPRDFVGRRLDRSGTWAVAFLAEWCPFSRAFAPRFAELDGGTAHLAIADMTDLETPLWETFDVEVVPTLVVFRDGTVVARVDGRPMEGLGPEEIARVRLELDGLRLR